MKCYRDMIRVMQKEFMKSPTQVYANVGDIRII